MPCNGGYGPTYQDIAERKELTLLRVAMCELMQLLEKKDLLSKAPKEAKIWWDEHKKEDRRLLEEELDKKRRKKDKDAAIEKLTPYERKLLRIKE